MSLIRGESSTKVDAPLSPARMDIIIREWHDSLERYTHAIAIEPLTVNLFSVAPGVCSHDSVTLRVYLLYFSIIYRD